MTKLKAGDVRKKGDQVKHVGVREPGPPQNWTGDIDVYAWQPVSLVGHTILSSDLMAAEFRRP